MAILKWLRAAWNAISHAVNVYTFATIILSVVFGATVLGVLYGFVDGWRELSTVSRTLFSIAIFGAMLLIFMTTAPWLWEHRPLKLAAPVSPLFPLRPLTERAVENIELKLEQLKYRENSPPWVHLKVINKGAPDEFKAEVTNVWYSEADQTQYTMKWREGTDSVRRVYKDDILDVAQIFVPKQTNTPTDSWSVDSTAEIAARASVTFERGYFSLFSVVLREGWPVYGQKELINWFGKTSTVPPTERPLLVFDEKLELHVRVMGTRGQIASGRINLGFQRPKWDYDSNNYESWAPPTATFQADAATLEP